MSVNDIQERRSRLSAAKHALLEKRLQGEFAGLSSAHVISRGSNHQHAPLSFAQQRLWFLDQIMPGNPAYNVCSAVRLKGKFSELALEKSLREIVRRHEVLRTTFGTVNEK